MQCYSVWSFLLPQVLYTLKLLVIRYEQCNKYPRVINVLTNHLQFILGNVQMQNLLWVALKLFIYLDMTIRKSWHSKHPATMLIMVYCISINSRCLVSSTQVRPNRSPPLRPLIFFYAGKSEDWRKFIVDCLQNTSKRVNNMVRRMILRYISMELYLRIVNEAEKVSPKFASESSHKTWLIYTYRPKNI